MNGFRIRCDGRLAVIPDQVNAVLGYSLKSGDDNGHSLDREWSLAADRSIDPI